MAICLVSNSLPGQEAARHAYGDIITGYSATSFNGNTVQSPYVGLEGELQGYWKDPRILQFVVSPNFVNGFQWVGPLIGPSSNGFDSRATFLGQSRTPVTLLFSRQDTPTPDDGSNSLFRPTSTLYQRFGVEGGLTFQRLPSILVRYTRDDNATYYSNFIEGDAQSKVRLFSVSSSYALLGWSLNGSYSNSDTSAFNTLALKGTRAQYLPPDTSNTASYAVSGRRSLPWRSYLQIDYSSTNTDSSIQQVATDISYDRATAVWSAQPTDRLDTNAQVNYLTDASAYAGQIARYGGGTSNPLDLNLLQQHSGLVTISTSLGYRILTNLRVYGGFATNRPVDVDYSALAPTQGGLARAVSYSYSGGVSYSRPLLGGRMMANYGITDSITHLEIESTILSHTVGAGYIRRLPWAIELTSNMSVGLQTTDYQLHNEANNYNFSLGLKRKVGNWTLDSRLSRTKLTYLLPNDMRNTSDSFTVSMSSSLLTLAAHYISNAGLSYLFGNELLPVSGLIAIGPNVKYTDGSSWGGSITYRPTRRLNIYGMADQGSQSVNGVPSNDFYTYGVKAEYKFRRVRVAAAYGASTQAAFTTTGGGNVSTGYYYFQIKRDFSLF